MKQIIKGQELPKEVILLANLPDRPIIGVLDNGGKKGWLQKLDYDNSHYTAFCLENGVSDGNFWSDYVDDTMDYIITNMLNHDFQLFLFSNEKELFKWLSK